MSKHFKIKLKDFEARLIFLSKNIWGVFVFYPYFLYIIWTKKLFISGKYVLSPGSALHAMDVSERVAFTNV